MKNKKFKIGDNDFELKLPDCFYNPPNTINDYMDEWVKLINEQKREEKRKLRTKKINEINAKNKD